MKNNNQTGSPGWQERLRNFEGAERSHHSKVNSWDRMRERMENEEDKLWERKHLLRKYIRRSAVAASLLLIISIGILLIVKRSSQNGQVREIKTIAGNQEKRRQPTTDSNKVQKAGPLILVQQSTVAARKRSALYPALTKDTVQQAGITVKDTAELAVVAPPAEILPKEIVSKPARLPVISYNELPTKDTGPVTVKGIIVKKMIRILGSGNSTATQDTKDQQVIPGNQYSNPQNQN